MPVGKTSECVIELKTRVLDVARKYLEVPADTAEETEARAVRLRPTIDRLAYGVFRIVVMGEIKKGKSSWICSLLGCPRLAPDGQRCGDVDSLQGHLRAAGEVHGLLPAAA